MVNLSASLNVQLLKYPQIIFFGRNNKLKQIAYRGNGIAEFTGPLVFSYLSPTTPLELDLTDNGAYCLAPDILKLTIQRGANIGKLVLENNDLGQQLQQDINGSVFQYYYNLTELNLAKNNIKVLPYNIFYHMPSMQVLNLSGNSLRMLDFKFIHFQKLNLLDLSNNLITDLNLKNLHAERCVTS